MQMDEIPEKWVCCGCLKSDKSLKQKQLGIAEGPSWLFVSVSFTGSLSIPAKCCSSSRGSCSREERTWILRTNSVDFQQMKLRFKTRWESSSNSKGNYKITISCCFFERLQSFGMQKPLVLSQQKLMFWQRDTPSPAPSVATQQQFVLYSSESGFNPQYTLSMEEELLSPLELQLKQAQQIKWVPRFLNFGVWADCFETWENSGGIFLFPKLVIPFCSELFFWISNSSSFWRLDWCTKEISFWRKSTFCWKTSTQNWDFWDTTNSRWTLTWRMLISGKYCQKWTDYLVEKRNFWEIESIDSEICLPIAEIQPQEFAPDVSCCPLPDRWPCLRNCYYWRILRSERIC